jgi:small-conductance mechanosensitive channel
MTDDKTKDEQIRSLTEQVGKLQQKLADERHVFNLLKSEHKMRLDQGEQLIQVHAELEDAQRSHRATVLDHLSIIGSRNVEIDQITAERDALTARVAELEQLLEAKNTSPQEPDAPHPE